MNLSHHVRGSGNASLKAIAVSMALVCHGAFIGAVILMCSALYGGMASGPISLRGGWAVLFDFALIIQFPVLHSLCLRPAGRGLLTSLFPGKLGRQLVTTTFVAIASVQLLALFGFWCHLGAREWSPTGTLLSIWQSIYVLSWILLGVSMVNAGLGIQMGYKGWVSVVRGQEPIYAPFPQGGLYKVCRHPVYFAMALVSCTGPVWNLDHAIVSSIFVAYCIVGPMIKDRRFIKMYGDAFVAFKERVPFFPTPASCWEACRGYLPR